MANLGRELIGRVGESGAKFQAYITEHHQGHGLRFVRDLIAVGSSGSEVMLRHFIEPDEERRSTLIFPEAGLNHQFVANPGGGTWRYDNREALKKHLNDTDQVGILLSSEQDTLLPFVQYLISKGFGSAALCLVIADIEATGGIAVSTLVPETGLVSAPILGESRHKNGAARQVHFNEEALSVSRRTDDGVWVFRQGEVQNGTQTEGRQAILGLGNFQAPNPLMELEKAYSRDRVLEGDLAIISQARRLSASSLGNSHPSSENVTLSIMFGRVDSFAESI